MSHDAKVVEVRQFTHDQVGYRVTCCDDPLEDSWIVLSIHIDDHEPQIEEYKTKAAERHEKMLAWREKHQK